MINKKRFSKISIITTITFLLMITLNALANILPINGQNTGEVSDAYPNLFAPAAYTFAIWGFIYLLLGLFTIYQLGFFRKNELVEKEKLFNTIRILFSISSIANSMWILAWHYELILLSTLLIFGILICLILINYNLNKWKLSFKDKLFIKIPFSVYFGWITVANIANITVFLVSINWYGWGLSDSTWAIIVLLLGFIVSSIVILKDRNIFYGLVIIWAYLGIYVKHISNKGFNGNFPLVSTTAIVCIVLLSISIVYTLFRKKKKSLLS